ncbi:uncharacterized protein LOC105638732 [Jatropha curcas]|uniref:uncharacterized protein LOC105638732 n=1 Tax=Jatropha curcas TaxID=180498 RepID=UPI0018958064|nr:uncharacterized protein LOC105638732 [Jatropha curcas]
MAFSSCLCLSQIPTKIDYPRQIIRWRPAVEKGGSKFFFSLKSDSTELFGQRIARVEADLLNSWSFLGGSRITIQPKLARSIVYQKRSGVYASCNPFCLWYSLPIFHGNLPAIFNYPLFSSVGVYMQKIPKICTIYITNVVGASFLGKWRFLICFVSFLLAFLFYNRKGKWASRSFLFYRISLIVQTRNSMESSIPYVVLALLYAYLLCLSWTPDTLRLMFASKYWLPELPGMAKMFSSEMTLASAWIHLLAVDLYAARQVFHDGLENEIETRHSVSLCLLFCPIGILTHVMTKALTKTARSTKHGT